MATKLQELLEELKELKRYYVEVDGDGDFELTEQGRQDLIIDPELVIKGLELETLITKYTETTPTYKPGDKVKVTQCLYGHEFMIGEIIELQDAEDDGWFAVNEDDLWWLTEEEFEPIN